jgi:transposase
MKIHTVKIKWWYLIIPFSPKTQKSQNPKNLKEVIHKIKETWDITTSKDTIKRILKSFSMTWHRVRRNPFKTPDSDEYQEKEAQLDNLKKQANAGEIDLRYLDESGFSLTSNSPYAWQEKSDPAGVKTQRSNPLNVLGLMNTTGELESYIFTESINSDVVIACINEFCESRTKTTVIAMDQASIHRNQKIENKRLEWEAKGVYIFWLPTYSPHLNLIEILWRFMKYEWIELNAYESLEALVEYIEKVLKGFGEEYIINFA